MPRIPTYQANQVGPVETTDVRLRAPDDGGGVGAAIGQGLQQFGQGLGQYAQVQDRINAQNDDTQARKLAVDGHTQFSAIQQQYGQLQGGNAREQHDATVSALNDAREKLIQQATNPRMRKFAEAHVGALYGDALDRITGHALEQSQVERAGALKGEVAMYADQAASEDDPLKQDGFKRQGLDATNRMLDFQGVADPMQRAVALKDFTSGVHMATIDRELAKPNPDVELVQHYLAAHADEMTAVDQGKVLKDIQAPLQAREADSDFIRATGGGVPQAAQPAGKPATGGNVVHITGASESRNRDFTASGEPVTSPKGAKYRMQVMPSTARDPGYGIKPAQDNSAAEWNRVGEEKISMLMRRYGDPAKAWAAYNWGEGNVDKAVKAHGPGWLSAAPAETRSYVSKNVAALDGSGHATQQPQEWDKTQALDQVDTLADKEGWTFERRERAKQRANVVMTRDESLLAHSQKAADDQAQAIVNQAGTAFTSVNQLPRDVRDALHPKDAATYERIAERNAKPKDVASNSPTLQALHIMSLTPGDDFKNANLAQYQGKVTPAEMDDLLQRQARLRSAKPAKGTSIPQGITAALSYGHRVMGVKAFSVQDQAAIMQTMEALANTEIAAGREPDYNGLFRKAYGNVGVTTDYGWLGQGHSAKPMYKVGLSDIPDGTRQQIVAAAHKTYGRDPTDAEMLAAYRAKFPFKPAP